ncbi:MAG TPA: hypothetical protein VFM14_00830 [Gemmatimonadales bacterium]|nr:hypothetical protein [Gemmatimonadales bacterium]
MSETERPGSSRVAPEGLHAPERTELPPEEEPVTTGTLFLTIVILMVIAAVWAIMYWQLVER